MVYVGMAANNWNSHIAMLIPGTNALGTANESAAMGPTIDINSQ